jgi:hypothetical protein
MTHIYTGMYIMIDIYGMMYVYQDVCELEPKWTIPNWWMAW